MQRLLTTSGRAALLSCLLLLPLAGCGGGSGGGGTSALLFHDFLFEGATHVPRNTELRVNFNSAIDPLSVSETNFAVLRPNDDVFNGRVVVEGNSLVFYPTVLPGDRNDYHPDNLPGINGLGFDANTTYRIRILGGHGFGIQNHRGSFLEHSISLRFTTGANFAEEPTPVFPVVEEPIELFFSPGPLRDGDPRSTNPLLQPMVTPRLDRVSVRFSEPMDPRSFDVFSSFSITNITEAVIPIPGLGEKIPGRVEWSDDARTFSFVFSFTLGDYPDTTDPFEFLLDITDQVTDLAGNPLSSNDVGLPFEEESLRLYFTTVDMPGERSYRTLIERFDTIDNLDVDDNPPSARWLGTGLLEAGEILRRSHQYVPPSQGFLLPDPLIGGEMSDPMNLGSRFQMAFRRGNLGGHQDGEVMTGMSWAPRSSFLFSSTYRDITFKVGRIGVLGGAGMSARYNDNFAGPSLTVFQGDYSVPSSLNTDWYPWPDFSAPFDFGEFNDFVIEVAVPPGADTFQLFRNTSTASTPRKRNIGPFGADVATNPNENTNYWTEFQYARIETIAYSKWFNTETDTPNYLDPVIVLEPDRPGTIVKVEWQGVNDDGTGQPMEPGPLQFFVEDLHRIDFRQYFRFRVTLTADPVNNIVPAIRSISVIYEFL